MKLYQPTRGTIYGVDEETADIQPIGGMGLLRHLEVYGDPSNLEVGDNVILNWVDKPGTPGKVPIVMVPSIATAASSIDNIPLGSITPEHLSFSIEGSGDIFYEAGWRVTEDGAIFGHNTVIHPSGQIALGQEPDIVKLDSTHTTHRIWAGDQDPADAPFSVQATGAIFATSGLIAGWSLATNSFTSDSGNAGIYSGSSPYMQLGGATGFMAGPAGWWVGKDSDTVYKMHLGDPGGDHLYWDGNELYITGTFVGDANISQTDADTFTINADDDDVDVGLIFMHPDGDASFTWDGADLDLDVPLIIPQLGIGANPGSFELFIRGTGSNTNLVVRGQTDDAVITLEAGYDEAAGENATIVFNQGTSAMWSIGNTTTDVFRIWDYTASRNIFGATPNDDVYVDPVNSFGVGVTTPSGGKLHIIDTAEQLRLGYDASNYTSFTVSSGGNLTVEPGGNLYFETGSGADQIDPVTGYKENLGQLSKKYLTLHAAELWVETLVAQDTIATIGGRVLVGPTTMLSEDLLSTTTITNYTENPGFETAGGGGADVFANWTENANTGTIGQSAITYRSGSYGAYMIAGSSSDTSITQSQSGLTPGDVLVLRFFSRSWAGDTSLGRYHIWDSTNSVYIIPITNVNGIAGSSEWTETVVNFTVPALCVSASIGLRCPTTTDDRVYIDDVTLTEGIEITVKHNQMMPGDTVYSEAASKVEFFWIIDGPGGVEDEYTYMVNRDLDGTGENDWYAGDAILNTGAEGNGFIDLYSYSGIKSGTTGPTIVGNIRNSTAYNDWSEHWAIGNLGGLYGYGADTYGSAFGKYEVDEPWISVDSTNGFRVMRYTDQLAKWDMSGNILIGGTAAGEGNVYIDSAGIYLRTAEVDLISLLTNGDALFGEETGGNLLWDSSEDELLVRNGTTDIMTFPVSGAAVINGTLEVVSPGKITAGGGDVILDTSGVHLGAGVASSAYLKLYVGTIGSSDYWAMGYDPVGDLQLVPIGSNERFQIHGSIHVENGIFSGSVLVAVGGGDIVATGDMRVGSGISVGSTLVGASDGEIIFDGAYPKLEGGTDTSLLISTGYGNVYIGPRDTGYCHFYTDRAAYYFDKNVAFAADGRFAGGVYAGAYTTDAPTGCFIGTGDVRVAGGGSFGSSAINPNAGDVIMTGGLTVGHNVDLASSGVVSMGNYLYIKAGSNNSYALVAAKDTVHGHMYVQDTSQHAYLYLNWMGGNSSYPGRVSVGNRNGGYGNIHADNFVNESTRESKRNIRSLKDDFTISPLDTVCMIKPMTFEKESTGDKRRVGMIAEDLASILPEVVAFNPETGSAEGIDYGQIVPVLVDAIKELRAEVQELRGEIQ